MTIVQPRHTFNVLALLLLPVLCLVGLIGNALVCIAISTDRRLHNVTNYFLFSLALADLLVCCIVMPLSIIVEVRHGLWTWNVSMCLLYIYSDVFLCSASIVHMSVISLDRYLGISQPLHTRNKSKTMILVKIAIVWLITLIISCPIAVLAFYDSTNILQNNTCMIFSQQYIIYGSTLTFLVPFCVMAVTYTRTTKLLTKQASQLSQKADEKQNGNGLRRTMPHRKLGYVRTNSTSTATTTTYTNGTTNQTFNHKQSVGNSLGHKPSIVSYSNGITLPNGTEKFVNRKSSEKSSAIDRWKSRTSNYLTSIANKVGRRNSIQAASQELANEHKATRVLAVVFMCFFICWTPFFAANFIMGFCGSRCSMPAWLGSVFLWLGYISSTINPIIYTVFNKRFRQAFVRILRCQCFHNIRDANALYSRNYTTVVPDNYTNTWSNYDRDRTMSSVNGITKDDNFLRNTDGIRLGESHSNSGKKVSLSSLPPPVPRLVTRGSRATTEDVSDDEAVAHEGQPLIPPRIHTSIAMRRSFTTLVTPVAGSVFNKSISCSDCQRALIDVMESSTESDTATSMSSSSFSYCRKHLTLFSSTFGKSVKETFL